MSDDLGWALADKLTEMDRASSARDETTFKRLSAEVSMLEDAVKLARGFKPNAVYGIADPAVLMLVASGYVGWKCTRYALPYNIPVYICSQACAEVYVKRGCDPHEDFLCQTCRKREGT